MVTIMFMAIKTGVQKPKKHPDKIIQYYEINNTKLN